MTQPRSKGNWPWAALAPLSSEIQLLIDASGVVLDVSPGGQPILGFATNPVRGLKVHDFVDPDSVGKVDALLATLVANPNAIQQARLPARTSDGAPRWLQVRARNDLGNPAIGAISVVYRDVTERQEIESKAQQQFALNNAFLQTVSALVLVVDLQGRIVRFNRACERATGYTEAEVQGLCFQDIFLLEEDRASVVEELQRIVQGDGSPDYENYWHTRDGRRIRIAWSSSRLTDAAGQPCYVIGTGLDVTEQRRTEATVSANLRFFQGLSRVDRISATGGVDFMRVVKATVDELLPLLAGDRSFLVRFHDDGSTARLDIVCQAFREDAAPPMREGDTVPLTPELAAVLREQKQLDRVGVWHVGLVTPLVGRFLSAFGLSSLLLAPIRVRTGGDWFMGVSRVRNLPSWSDEQLQLFAEIVRRVGDTLSVHDLFRSVRESAAQLNELAETVPDIVWTADKTGAVQFFNRRWYQATGLTEQASLRWGWLTAVHRDDVEAVHQSWLRAVETGDEWEESFRLLHAEQGYHWQLARARPLAGDDGRPLRWFASLTDIDQQRRTEAALHASQEQLRQAQKMEAVGRLAGGVAHDFNNLLTAINGYADLMLLSSQLDGDVRSQLTEIRNAGERAAQLTGQLLAFSRKQVLAPQRLDLCEVLRSMDRLLLRLIGDQVELETVLPDAPLWIVADPNQIEQVMLNLAINARDAMPDGGKLVIRARYRRLAELEALALQVSAGDWIELLVSDTGRGMDEHTRQRVFEPFFTTKPPGQGTGLGLSTVYAILQQCGAAVEVDSSPGRGARFRLLFPVASADAPPTALPQPREPQRVLGGKETILLVEDDESVRKLVVEVLQRLGYEVRAVANAAAALRSQSRRQIHLLLTDVVLHGPSGFALATKLWERHPRLPVLFMSGYTDDEVFRRGVRDRRHEFLAKPFSPETLARKVREVLDSHRAGPEPSASDRPL